MALINPTIPTLGDFNATEDPDIRSSLITIRDEINGNLDNANIKPAAGIVPSKIANQTAGQLLIANASGVITGTAVTGDVTIGSTGFAQIGNNTITNAKMADDSVGSAEIIDNNVLAAEIGTLPTARVYASANLAVANSTNVALGFNTETLDTDSMHDNVTNNTRLTATTAGVYIIVANIQWDNNVSGSRSLSLRINGATTIAQNTSIAQAPLGVGYRHEVSTIYKLAATDYVEAVVFQDSGGSVNVSGAIANNHFAMVWQNDG